ncbi:MAG TPA: glycosyltransferase family 2 protein [Thermoanaerobaculia bacterium]|jgi:glycosyltransferase involved in cell wall biosynthesis
MLVSVITPSFQQGRFIERTLASVRRQRGRTDVEHIVKDGGSTDGTLEILESWRNSVAFTSGPDGGQTAAINAGFAEASGEVLAYLNSDDVYYDGAVDTAVEAFERDPALDVVYGNADYIDADDRTLGRYPTEEWSLDRLKLVCFLCQPAVFFRQRVIERFGPLDRTLQYCMDYEYWLRLALNGAKFHHVPLTMAGSRIHLGAKTVRYPKEAHTEINDMLARHLGKVPDNWLANFGYAVLDGDGRARTSDRRYLLRVALHSVGAAFRWNGFPSVALLRWLGSSVIHRKGVDSPVGIIA